MIFMQRGRRLDEVGAVTAVGVIFHDEWQVIGPALIAFPWQDLPAEMFHCLESFNFHFFKTKVSLCPVGISYRHTLPPLLSPSLSTVFRLVEFKVLT